MFSCNKTNDFIVDVYINLIINLIVSFMLNSVVIVEAKKKFITILV
jgi:hypothetical protein